MFFDQGFLVHDIFATVSQPLDQEILLLYERFRNSLHSSMYFPFVIPVSNPRLCITGARLNTTDVDRYMATGMPT